MSRGPTSASGGQRYRRLEVTAHHEAAHAVVAVHCRARFDHITVLATDDEAGALVGLRLRHGQDDDVIRISLAGVMAMRLMYRRWQAGLLDRTRDDIALAADSTRRMPNASRVVDWCVQDNDRVLRSRWDAVSGVAALLIERGEVDHAEVVKALAAPVPTPRREPLGHVNDWRYLTSVVFSRAQFLTALEAGEPWAITLDGLGRSETSAEPHQPDESR